MPLVSLKQVLPQAKSTGYAVGAFNIFDQLCMQSVVEAAVEMNSPVIIQVLPPVVRQFGSKSIAYWARALSEEHPKIPMVLHLDHGRDLSMVSECIDNGWNSVMIDASDQALERNITVTQEVIDKARRAGVTVEGEVGCIFSVEEKQEIREKAEHLASTDACQLYCNETTVDALAPAIGTAHGLYKDKPNLNCERLQEIAISLDAFLVIHGGTGLTSEDFHRLIHCGANKINIATQIYMEYCQTMRGFTKDHPHSNDPGEFFAIAGASIKATVKKFINIFGCAGKA
jgi:fructose-bisphosphate aldolase, class II